MFPIGMWNAVALSSTGASDVADWRDLGFTVAMSPKFDGASIGQAELAELNRILDAAANAGISIIMRDARATWGRLSRGEEFYRRTCGDAVGQFGTHPSVMGFYVGDEPDKTDLPHAGRACRIHQELAPTLAPYLNLLPWYERAERLFGVDLSAVQGLDGRHPALLGVDERVGYSRCDEYLDGVVEAADPPFLSYDCYAQMLPGRVGWNMYFNNLREYAAAAARHERSFWSTVLCIGHFAYRVPSEDDLRWQLSTSVAHGASGVMWYYAYQERTRSNYRLAPIDEHGSRTQTFEALARVNKTFLSGPAPSLEQARLIRACHTGEEFGGFKAPTDDPVIRLCTSLTGTPMIVSRFVATDGSTLIVVVNNSPDTSVLGQLVLNAGGGTAIDSIGWRNEAVPARRAAYGYHEIDGGAVILEWFAPGQMYVYRLTGPSPSARHD